MGYRIIILCHMILSQGCAMRAQNRLAVTALILKLNRPEPSSVRGWGG